MGTIKNKAIEIAIKQGLEKIKEDPDKNLPKLIEIIKKFDKDNMWASKYEFLEKITKDKDNNWNKYIRNILEDIDDDIIEKFLCNFIVNSAIKGISRNHEIKETEGCPAPWAIVMDPTTACNMKCTGCWAADYGKSLNLGFDLMDRIITEGKEIGCYWYLFTGGEQRHLAKDSGRCVKSTTFGNTLRGNDRYVYVRTARGDYRNPDCRMYPCISRRIPQY